MRALDLETTKPPGMSTEEWVGDQLTKIAEASREDTGKLAADGIAVSNFAEIRSLDCANATLDDLRKVVGTLIRFMQQGAPRRSE